MGYRYSLRFVVMGFAAALCSLTFATTSPAYFDPSGSAASPYDNMIVISLADLQSPAFDILPMVKEDRVASSFPAFRLRPTALSGWRSGRIRTLVG